MPEFGAYQHDENGERNRADAQSFAKVVGKPGNAGRAAAAVGWKAESAKR